jgi:hypothetical protein
LFEEANRKRGQDQGSPDRLARFERAFDGHGHHFGGPEVGDDLFELLGPVGDSQRADQTVA